MRALLLATAVTMLATGGAGAAPLNAGAIGEAADTVGQVEQVFYRARSHGGHARSPRSFGNSMSVQQQIGRANHSDWQARQRILYDTRTRVFEQQQEDAIRRVRNADRAWRAWQRYLDD